MILGDNSILLSIATCQTRWNYVWKLRTIIQLGMRWLSGFTNTHADGWIWR